MLGISCPSMDDAYFSLNFDPPPLPVAESEPVSENDMLFLTSSITMSSTAGSTSMVVSSSPDFLARNSCFNSWPADGRVLASSPMPRHVRIKLLASVDLTRRILDGGMPCVTFL